MAKFVLLVGGTIAGLSFFEPVTGHAGIFGDISRAARTLGGIPGGGYKHRHQGGSGSGSRSSDDDDDSSSSSSDSNQNTLQSALKDAKNAAAAISEWQEMDRAKRLEKGRNVDAALVGFIDLLKKYHRDILHSNVNVEAATGLNINQVTTGELRRGAEDAYRKARLYEFERYAGELWTRDRLMVRLIQQSETGLKPYFEGVGAKGPSMADINDLFSRSGVEVYSKALEVSEIVGVSLSFDRFIRAMYENSDRTEGLWAKGTNEQADGLYERLATTLIDTVPREKFIQDGAGLASDPLGLERQFQYRFRARRALYDCLTAHYAEFVSGPSGGQAIEAAYAGNSQGGGANTPASSPDATSKGLVPEAAPSGQQQTGAITGAKVAANAQTNEPDSLPAPKAATVVVLGGDAELIARAQAYIGKYCRDSTLGVATLAREGKIEPISTRVDASNLSQDGEAGGGGLSPAVLSPQ